MSVLCSYKWLSYKKRREDICMEKNQFAKGFDLLKFRKALFPNKFFVGTSFSAKKSSLCQAKQNFVVIKMSLSTGLKKIVILIEILWGIFKFKFKGAQRVTTYSTAHQIRPCYKTLQASSYTYKTDNLRLSAKGQGGGEG